MPWRSSETSSPGTSSCRRGGTTSAWSCRPRSTRSRRARRRSPRSCTPRSRTRCAPGGSTACGRTRPRRCTPRWAGPTIVTTGTASGKSLCFNLPTLDVLCRDARARALYLYPTKALAQDQARALNALGVAAGPAGDLRRRHAARAALGDPAALEHRPHQPRHAAPGDPAQPPRVGATSSPTSRSWWSTRRTCTAACSARTSPTCCGACGGSATPTARRRASCSASATIANPGELAERLTGLDEVTVVDRDGAPAAKRTIAMWNPPIVDEKIAARRSVLAEAADLLADLVTEEARTIVFMKSRKAVELMSRFAQLTLADRGRQDLADRVAPYRAGYTAAAAARARGAAGGRRAARRRLHRRARAGHRHRLARRGDLRHVPGDGRLAAADVGPRRPPRPRPGALRGRRGRARPVLLPPPRRVPRPPGGGGDPRPVERAGPRRAPAVRGARGAARRTPTPSSSARTGARSPRRWCRPATCASGRTARSSRAVPRSSRPPRCRCGRRAATRWRSSTRGSGEMHRQRRRSRARTTTVHDGAIYLHGGRSYEVDGLDLDDRRALVHPFDGDWYTQPKKETDTYIERLIERRSAARRARCRSGPSW